MDVGWKHGLLVSTLSFLLWGGCGTPASSVETVPAFILDPGSAPIPAAQKRKEYPLAEPAATPHFPIPVSAQKTDSGLRFVVFKRGDQHKHPTRKDEVSVHYEGRTTDGKVFDSSIARGEPITFRLTQVIPGWREGVKLMTVGDVFRFWIPEEYAYRGAPGKPAGMLIFDVSLLEIVAE